ncbi:MAG: PorT family protein [Flavobacteriales bacterium]|nr:PorT family protein [Flavobacteriales bacterium]MCB9449248.1 PorT family protein [Flavobacteriales bacterium]
MAGVSSGYGQNFKACLRLGVSTSQVSGDDLGGFDKIGFAGGAFASLATSEKFSWEMGIHYVEKGSRKAANPGKGDYRFYLMALQYMEVPVLLRYHKDNFIFGFGPSFGALIGSKEKDQYGDIPYNPPRPFNKTELNANLTIAYNLGERWEFQWRLDNSILPIRPHAAGAVYRWNRGQYNNVLMFMLGYNLK